MPITPLTVVEVKALQALLKDERKIVELALLPKISELEPLDVITEFIEIISVAFTRSGQQTPQDKGVTLGLYAEEFYNELNDKYPRVTIAEVKEALRRGVYGEYGEYFGLNPKTFLNFVKRYLFSDQRSEAKRLFNEKKLRLNYSSVQMSPEQKELDDKEFTNHLFRHYLKGCLLVDYIPPFIYYFITSQGLLKLDKKQKQEYIEKGKSYVTRLSNSNKLTGSRETVKDHFAQLDPDNSAKTSAMQFSVLDFFENCKKEGKETIFSIPKLLANGK